MDPAASLNRIVEKIHDLPTLPVTVSRLLNLLNDPQTAFDQLERVLSCDAPLITKVLRIANSTYYGKKDIKTISQAVLLVGFAPIRAIAVTASVFSTFPGAGRPEFNRVEFWRHSVAVAVAAQMIAARMREVDPDEAFLAGLLHDIGKIVLDEYASDVWQKALDLAVEKRVHIAETEKEVLGITHAQVGRWLAVHWKLPPLFPEVIHYHHHPLLASHDREYVTLVHVADSLARRVGLGWGGDSQVPPLDRIAMEQNQLVHFEAEDVLKALPETYFKAVSNFGPPVA